MILAFDTATEATAVALCDFEQVELEWRDDPPAGQRPRHTARLMPFVVEILATQPVGWQAVEKIAVGVGPGTFTGLRIGLATARALALALALPLTGVSTLESLALAAAECTLAQGAQTILAAIDARRGEVFAAAWRTAPSNKTAHHEFPLGRELIVPRALTPEALATLLGDLHGSTLAVGTGAVKFRAVLERAGAFIPEPESELHRVSAISHCRLAQDLPGQHPDDVHPEYLRLPDAEMARHSSGTR